MQVSHEIAKLQMVVQLNLPITETASDLFPLQAGFVSYRYFKFVLSGLNIFRKIQVSVIPGFRLRQVLLHHRGSWCVSSRM